MSDLLALAGGVRDGAFLGSVEIRRRLISNDNVRNVIKSGTLQAMALYATSCRRTPN